MKLLFALSLLLPALAAASTQYTVGVARDTQSGEVRYLEYHRYDGDGGHEIHYFSADFKPLATKRLRYRERPQHPAIEQVDHVEGTRTTLDYDDGEIRQVVAGPDEELTRFSLGLAPDVVVDAGFDAYLRSDWANLTNDSATPIRFAVAGQDRLLPMNIKPVAARTFTITPRNWFLRQLLPEIRLHYDDQRRLDRYEGFSNFAPPAGASRTVVIEFDHFTRADALPDWALGHLNGAQGQVTSRFERAASAPGAGE